MTNEEYNVDEAQVGRVLHFVIDDRGRSRCRPALVVEDWPDSGRPGYVNLVVFPDGSNDGKYGIDDHNHGYHHDPMSMPIGGPAQIPPKTDIANVSLLTRWETSVFPNHAVRAVRSWHWPRECGKLAAPADPYTDVTKNIVHHNHAAGMVDTHNCYACATIERESKLQDKAKS